MDMYLDSWTVAVLIVLILMALWAVYAFTKHYYEERILTLKKVFEAERPLSAIDRERLKEGFVFTTLWHISDIHKIAEKRGMVLTHAEAIKVVSLVIRDFQKHQGVTEFTIRMALKELVKSHFRDN